MLPDNIEATDTNIKTIIAQLDWIERQVQEARKEIRAVVDSGEDWDGSYPHQEPENLPEGIPDALDEP